MATYLRVLAFGNIEEAQIEKICQLLSPDKIVPVHKKAQKVTKLTSKLRWDYQIPSTSVADESMEDEEAEEEMNESDDQSGVDEQDEEHNSCTTVYFQSRKHDFETECCLQLLEAILGERMFD